MNKHKSIEKALTYLGNVTSPVELVRLFHLTVHSAEATFHKVIAGGQGLCLSHSLQCVLVLEQSLETSWCSLNVY